MLKEFLECGKIQNTHGVKGMMRIGHLCDSVDVFCSLTRVYTEKNGEYKEHKVVSAHEHGAVILLSLEDITTIEEAQLLKGGMLYARREDLPLEEGSHFIADLIGLKVYDAESGRLYGTLTDVMNRGASDVYEIKTPSGEVLMPAVDEFVREVDLERGIFITPIEGMFPDEV
ncbi:MAG: 16S rRNA processing protein RimM [Ruminococcaceae bacterium]|nr:16S rRNA processing protein RimM [Oscillospiraceae bacterium]